MWSTIFVDEPSTRKVPASLSSWFNTRIKLITFPHTLEFMSDFIIFPVSIKRLKFCRYRKPLHVDISSIFTCKTPASALWKERSTWPCNTIYHLSRTGSFYSSSRTRIRLSKSVRETITFEWVYNVWVQSTRVCVQSKTIQFIAINLLKEDFWEFNESVNIGSGTSEISRSFDKNVWPLKSGEPSAGAGRGEKMGKCSFTHARRRSVPSRYNGTAFLRDATVKRK